MSVDGVRSARTGSGWVTSGERPTVTPMTEYTFGANLVGWSGISRTVAVRGNQTLVDLHSVLQTAFEWDDDHLYSFWLSGRFWDHDGSEYSPPGWCERVSGAREPASSASVSWSVGRSPTSSTSATSGAST